ncbi:MAG: alpha/beta fold hydrolase [Bacillota bacterium]
MTDKDTNTIKVGGITLSYYRKGNGNKALLLLHGNSENATIFSDFLDTVSNKYKTYAIDLRGHGKSEAGDGDFSIKSMAIDIIRFIHQKPFEKVSIVGYSDGANIAMVLAKLAPELIEKMVLISGNIYAKALSKSFYRITKLKYNLYEPFKKMSKKIFLKTTKLALMLNNIGIYPEDLNKLDFPTLVIDAEKDIVDKDHTALIARSIPNSKHITIKDTNHMDIIRNKQLFKEINNFLT